MGKVVITQEQADLIEQFKMNFKGFGREVLIETLDGHYEIKKEFKKDDWVHVSFKSGSKIAKILNSYHEVIQFYDNENLPNIKIDNQTRHATPTEITEEKQRRFWHENGREVGEFKNNDVIYNKNFGEVDEVTSNQTLPNYEDEYEIICFAHDRKDIKNE